MKKPKAFVTTIKGTGYAVSNGDYRVVEWDIRRNPTPSDNIIIMPSTESGKHFSFHIPFKIAARLAAALLTRMGYEIMPAGTTERIQSIIDDWPNADSDDESESHINGGDCVDWYCSNVRPAAKDLTRAAAQIRKELAA